jgi:hypothetical protein
MRKKRAPNIIIIIIGEEQKNPSLFNFPIPHIMHGA